MRLSLSSRSTSLLQSTLGWSPSVLLALLICAGPLWLWGVPLGWFELKSDDFVYLARSRSWEALCSHWLAPHNGHIVPLFLLQTHLLARLAGSLEALPVALGWASYATLVITMLLAGHLVAWETGRAGNGLAAMAAVGFTSVLGTAVLWYSAGQALAAGTMILVMLATLQTWRLKKRWWLLLLAMLAAAAAPLFWTAGYTAGLVGAAYLWADRRRVCQRAAVLPILVSVATFLATHAIAPRFLGMTAPDTEKPIRTVVQLGPAIAHSAQAICEVLIFNNLGLDAKTTASQAFVIGMAMAVLWIWTRRGLDRNGVPKIGRINPLEAAGALIVTTSFGMIYAVRGTESTFDGLRALGWYDAIPAVGGVLFAAGWWSGIAPSTPPTVIVPPSRMEFLTVSLLVAAMLVLQAPRVERVIYQYDGLSARYGQQRSSRTPEDLAAQARTQRQALAALDRLERSAHSHGMSPNQIRHDAEHILVPGMPTGFSGVGSTELLNVARPPGESLRPDDKGTAQSHE